MDVLLASPAAYLVPFAYLCFVAAWRRRAARIPAFGHVCVAACGASVDAFASGWGTALAATLTAAAIFVVLVMMGAVTRLSVFSLCVALACLPVVPGLAAVGAGVVAAAAWSALLVRKAAGPGYLAMLAGETFSATGLTGMAGGGASPRDSLPDLSRLPLPDRDGAAATGHETSPSRAAAALRVALAGFLAASVGVAGLVSVAVFAA